MLMPIKKFVSRLMSATVDPTAASEWVDPKLPNTAMSDALNNSCKTLAAIKGMANRNIDGNSAPSVISISDLVMEASFAREYNPKNQKCVRFFVIKGKTLSVQGYQTRITGKKKLKYGLKNGNKKAR